jgi:hypothetical protein
MESSKFHWSGRIFLIACAVWLLAFLSWNIFSASPLGKNFWSYNNDAKGPVAGEYNERTWACTARNGGYWSCTPKEGLMEAIILTPFQIIASFFLPIFVISKFVNNGLGVAEIIRVILFFPPTGIFLIYLFLFYGAISTKRFLSK